MNPTFRTALLAASVSLCLAACQEGASTPAAVEGADKINAYIACFNGVQQPIQESFQRYVSWIADPAAGPTGKEETVCAPGTVLSHRVEFCAAPLTAALAQQPANAALDPAARRYQESFTALNEKIGDAVRYYDREDYKRDGGEGMRQRHAPLMQAYAAFFEAGDAMDAALEANEDQRRKEQIAAIEKEEGRSAAFYHLSIIGEGKQLVKVLDGDAPDLAAGRAQLARYQAVLEEAAKAKIGQGDPMWGHMERSADKLASEGGRRIERLQANQPLSRSEQMLLESGSMPPSGTAPALLASYNDLVDMSNRMAR